MTEDEIRIFLKEYWSDYPKQKHKNLNDLLLEIVLQASQCVQQRNVIIDLNEDIKRLERNPEGETQLRKRVVDLELEKDRLTRQITEQRRFKVEITELGDGDIFREEDRDDAIKKLAEIERVLGIDHDY